ncbi:unnamed protein product [Closterium sp. NIES-54]
MYALSFSAEGDCYRCVPPDPGIAAAALGASASGTPPGTAPAEALHTFTLDSGASRCFFRDSTTLTPLPAPVLVRLADPSGGPVVARSSTVLPCPAVPSGSLSGLHLPSFSTNLVSTAALQDAMVTTTTPGGQRVSICTCTRTGRHLATFTRRPGSSLYTLATEPPQVAASAQVSASGQVAASCSCRLLSHQTLLWHHRLGHPSLARLRGMHSRFLVSGLPRVSSLLSDASVFRPASPLLIPSPYIEQSGGLTEHCEPASRPVSPVCTTRRAPRLRPPPVPGTHTMALRPSSVPLLVPLPAPPESSLPKVPGPESDQARAAGPTVARLLSTAVTDPSFESATASALVAELLDFAAACRLDYASALVAESVPSSPLVTLGAAMDAEMASWKSTSTYVDEVPPPGANIVDGMWIFRVKRLPGSPPAFKARYVARGFSQRQGVDYFHTFSPTPKLTTLWVLLHVVAQRDYELHSLDFSTAFMQGNLHKEIWLRRPPGFTGTFPAGTQWSLRRPVYGLRKVPREWHDTLRTTLAALGFVPSTADPSLFLRTDTSLPPFYVLVYLGLHITRDRARHTITLTQSHMVHQVLQRFGLQYSLPQLTPLSTSHSLSAPPSDESVEPSGPYPEVVGCLMHLMTCTRPDLAYPLSLLARYVAPGRHQKVHWDAAKRVLRYLCSTSSCEAEIYAGAMAAQELRWLTYLLTDLVEQPRSPPVLYVDNKAMIALCQEHRLEHRTKHIALRYFLARELQQRGQLRLAYVATRANTADVFTKALPPAAVRVVTDVLPVVGVVAAVVAVAVELFGGEFLEVAKCSCIGVSTNPSHPISYVSGMLVRVVAAAVVAVTRGTSRSRAGCPYVIRTGDRAGQTCGTVGHTQSRCLSCLSDTWRAEFGDAAELPLWLELIRQGVDVFALDYDILLSTMYALSDSAEGDYYRGVPPDPGIAATALGASESGTLFGTTRAEALHTFTLDSSASRCFFRDSTILTPLPAPVPVQIADPSGDPVVAHSSTELPCPAVPSGSLSGLHLPSFSTNLVSIAALQDLMVTTTTSGGQRVLICTCTRTGCHLATSGSRLLLVSPPVTPDSSMAPPPGSPLPATPSWHALSSSCLWSS